MEEVFQVVDVGFVDADGGLFQKGLLCGIVRLCQFHPRFLGPLVPFLDTGEFLFGGFAIQDVEGGDPEREILDRLVEQTDDMTDDFPFVVPEILPVMADIRETTIDKDTRIDGEGLVLVGVESDGLDRVRGFATNERGELFDTHGG